MAVNLAVMDVVGRQEAPVFTWNPVEQMWVQERGGATKAPPAPHDIHAIQTWFLDVDEAEWIQTVLGPMGRQLAAQWRGAYRVPDAAIGRQSKSSKNSSKDKTIKDRKRSPLPILLAALVLIALIGGAVAASSLMGAPTQSPAAATLPGSVAASPPAPTAPGAEEPAASPTAAPTAAPTEAPTTQAPPPPPRATPRPATAVPRPAGISVTFGNGTTVVYTGPLSINRGANLPGTFTVILGNGRPASGVFTIMLGNLSQPLRTVEGSLDPARGTIAMGVPATLPAGNWPLYFKFEGAIVQIATIAVR